MQKSISDELRRILKCPDCDHPTLEVIERDLSCPNCNSSFPVINAVPDFIKDDETHKGFEYQWTKKAQGQFEGDRLYGKSRSDELSQFFQYLEIDEQDIAGKNILDGGCGSGRLVSMLGNSEDANVFGIDISSTILGMGSEICTDNVHLIRGNLLKAPLKENSIDLLWTGGVIHHTGDTELAFRNLARAVRAGGKMYVWVYSVNQKVFGRVRELLPGMYRLPGPVLRLVCKLLAVPIYLGGIAAGRAHPFAEVEFKLFDHLCPRYRTVHSDSEVIGWFEQAGFRDVRVHVSQTTGGVGAMGVKA